MKQKHKVLIVEDDAYLLSGIKEILELGEYSVMTAHNGLEGLQILGNQKDQPPDLILSDITMPYMDGFRFLEEVRKEDNWVKIPFIFLTAHGERVNKQRGAQLGADVYLTKPFQAEELLVQVESRIGRFRGLIDQLDGEGKRAIDSVKDKVLSMLQHGITPDTIAAYTELFHDLNTGRLHKNEFLPLLRNVNEGANLLRRLVENFITLVEIDSGDLQRTCDWRRRPVPHLQDVVTDAYHQITYPDDRLRRFVCEIPAEFPEVVFDVQTMTMAIREVLDNAARVTPAGGHYILRASHAEGWFEIQVQDFGRGLPESEFENIWLAFYQYGRERFDSRGVGAGLALVDGIVKIHGGTHSIVSQEGVGTTITLRLPIKPPTDIPRIGRVVGVNSMKQKLRVLIVEDDAHLLSGIKEILELENYTVLTAHNGVDGLKILNENAHQLPHIIVSDVAMPYMDGFSFLEEVRKEDRWVKIPFIFLTAHGERPDRYKGFSLGADDYLSKPFNAPDLLMAVQTKIDRIAKIQDVTERENQNAVGDVKRKILTILNHEFRTPLTLVVAYAELLKEFDPESMDEGDVMTFLKGVNSGANRLRRLVENFITLVELDSGDLKRSYDWRKRPIVSLYDHIMEAHQQITYPDDQPRSFECHVDENIPEFIADAQMLTMAVRELLDNAAKFTPANGTFILRAQCVGDWIEIQVQDSGRGLPATEFEKVWQPFYQFERDKFEHQGAGSGLAIVQGILDIHGGKRSVASELGHGCTFTIRLPVQPPASS